MSLVPAAAALNTAGDVAAFAGRHQEDIKKLFNIGAKGFRAYQKKRTARNARNAYAKHRSSVGKAPSYRGSPKAFTPVDTNPTALTTRTFYEQELTDIPKDTGVNDIDQRQRDMCFVQGFKMLASLENTGTKPVHFNMAVVMNRTAPASSPSANEFFKGSGSTRGIDFNFLLNSNDFRSRPINGDKNVVLMHKRVTLSPAGTTSYDAGWKPSYHNIDCYVPLKRILTFDAGVANNRIYLVYWCDEFNTATSTTPATGKLTFSNRVITYFKEPKVTY